MCVCVCVCVLLLHIAYIFKKCAFECKLNKTNYHLTEVLVSRQLLHKNIGEIEPRLREFKSQDSVFCEVTDDARLPSLEHLVVAKFSVQNRFKIRVNVGHFLAGKSSVAFHLKMRY